jgi:hypothetical protein
VITGARVSRSIRIGATFLALRGRTDVTFT